MLGIQNVDALIVGAGPGGMTAAHTLAKELPRGAKLMVLEGGDRVDPRLNGVLEWKATGKLRTQILHGPVLGRLKHSGGPITLGRITNDMRAAAERRGIPVHYNSAVAGTERLADGRVSVTFGDAGHTIAARYLINASGRALPGFDAFGLQMQRHSDENVGFLMSFHENPSRAVGHVRDDHPVWKESRIVDQDVTFGTYAGRDGVTVIDVLQRGEQLTPEEMLARTTQSARSIGQLGPEDGGLGPLGAMIRGPELITVRPVYAQKAADQNVLSVGAAVSKFHPSTSAEMNLSMADGHRAGHAVASALRTPSESASIVRGYEDETMRTHVNHRRRSEEAFHEGL